MGKRVHIASGDLRHTVDVHTKTESLDATGFPTFSWAKSGGSWWAKIEPARGDEVVAGDQDQARQAYKFTGRHRTDITPDARLVYDSRTFHIQATANVLERNELVQVIATEMVTGADKT